MRDIQRHPNRSISKTIFPLFGMDFFSKLSQNNPLFWACYSPFFDLPHNTDIVNSPAIIQLHKTIRERVKKLQAKVTEDIEKKVTLPQWETGYPASDSPYPLEKN